jgi:Family of unknown function (DUF6502)
LSTDDAPGAATLQAALAILEPLAGLLLSRQLRYAEAEEALKAAFVQASARAFVAQGKLPSVSTLSVATGIRRREVKRLLEEPQRSTPRTVPAASQARLRWITDPKYLDPQGHPLPLPRTAPEGQPSFASLAATISKDTHPRALFDDLLRVGAVAEEDGKVVLQQRLFTHSPQHDAAMAIAGANVGDHLSAVLINLLSDPSPLMERAIFADGLTQASAQKAAELSRDLWQQALASLREQLQALVEQDAQAPDNHWRMRIGIYGYYAPEERPQPPTRQRAPRKTRPQGDPP